MLRQLSAAPRTRAQLADKLADRDVPDDVAEQILDRFEELRLIDDAEFARQWVRSRSEHKQLARSALRRELAQKGIDRDVGEEALEQVSDESEYDAAVALVRRRARPSDIEGDRQERQRSVRRLVSMLARKGHPPSTAFRAVEEVLGELEIERGELD